MAERNNLNKHWGIDVHYLLVSWFVNCIRLSIWFQWRDVIKSHSAWKRSDSQSRRIIDLSCQSQNILYFSDWTLSQISPVIHFEFITDICPSLMVLKTVLSPLLLPLRVEFFFLDKFFSLRRGRSRYAYRVNLRKRESRRPCTRNWSSSRKCIN